MPVDRNDSLTQEIIRNEMMYDTIYWRDRSYWGNRD